MRAVSSKAAACICTTSKSCRPLTTRCREECCTPTRSGRGGAAQRGGGRSSRRTARTLGVEEGKWAPRCAPHFRGLRRASFLTADVRLSAPCPCPSLLPRQFSVTEHFRSVSSREGQGLPGVFFFYELSPIMVKFTETRKSLPHFLTQLCAILGGVFTVAGMLDRLVRRHARTVDGLVDGWGDSGPRRPDAFAAALSNWANDEAVGSRKGIGRADHHRAPRTQIAHCACLSPLFLCPSSHLSLFSDLLLLPSHAEEESAGQADLRRGCSGAAGTPAPLRTLLRAEPVLLVVRARRDVALVPVSGHNSDGYIANDFFNPWPRLRIRIRPRPASNSIAASLACVQPQLDSILI